MGPFQVGDKFRANDFAGLVEVRWVDPQDGNCAVVFDIANQFGDETVFATEFFNDWTIMEEGAPASNRRRERLEATDDAAALFLSSEPA